MTIDDFTDDDSTDDEPADDHPDETSERPISPGVFPQDGSTDDRPPLVEMVEEIHESVVTDDDGSDRPSEWVPAPDGKYGHALRAVAEHGPTAIKDCDALDGGHSSHLTNLWRAGYVTRISTKKPHIHDITPAGQALVDEWAADGIEGADADHDHFGPWHYTPLTRHQYAVLELVDQHDGHPTAEDLPEPYHARGLAKVDAEYIEERLEELHGEGYVDRPDEPPRMYWVTDDGAELLEEGDDS